MRIYYVVLFIIVAIVAFLMTKSVREESQKKYDERQLTEQMKGYKYGFFSVLLFLIVYAVIGNMTDMSWFTPDAVAITGIGIGVAVFAAYSIWKGAYFNSQMKSQKNVCWLFGIVGIMNAWLATTKILSGQMIEEGELTGAYMNLVIGVLFLVIFLVSCVKELKDRKEE